MSTDWKVLAERLATVFGPGPAPIAITFTAEPPGSVPTFEDPMPERLADGRTGRVSAGCVFWMKGTERTFSTVAADHANCSVGSVTHGFKTLEDVAGNEDVAALLECNWVTEDVVPLIPTVQETPGAVTYGPLAETPIDPDVILLRLTGRQLMVLHDAWPELRIEGKPQCHIVALAKEEGAVAASVGCQLSRVRTGMPNAEVTCAIPGARLADVAAAAETAAIADQAVASYASNDMQRFGPV